MGKIRLPKLPQLLERKIYKSGQTRGADDDEVYQNRVGRNSTVLIPRNCWPICSEPAIGDPGYENGFIVLVSPDDYFKNANIAVELAASGLVIGQNTLIFYETRSQWVANNPEMLNWEAANRRVPPLGGQYVARISATTSLADGGKINRGFITTSMKGAGIRVYEYASTDTIQLCRLQLEALFWMCRDSTEVAVANGMPEVGAATRKTTVLATCRTLNLLDAVKLTKARILNAAGATICPLCLDELSSKGFFARMEQAAGREVHDLTITQLNLFHIAELRFGVLNHRPYNIGWGHHHCNVVVKDSGINETIEWMRGVINRNVESGYLPPENSES